MSSPKLKPVGSEAEELLQDIMARACSPDIDPNEGLAVLIEAGAQLASIAISQVPAEDAETASTCILTYSHNAFTAVISAVGQRLGSDRASTLIAEITGAPVVVTKS